MLCVRARLQSCHHSIHKNLEINQRDEVALKSRSTTKPGCPILAALLFLPQGWETTNVERGSLCVRERGGLCVRERGGLCVRARLQSCRKCRRINAGFSPCGKFDPEGGGGLNPRIKPAQITRALAPEGKLIQTDPLPFIRTCSPTPLHTRRLSGTDPSW